MRKLFTIAFASTILIAACGDDDTENGVAVTGKEAGTTVSADECAWTAACPTGWTAGGNTCVYGGETVSVSGIVEVFSLGSKVEGAVIRVQNFGDLLPACGVSGAGGVYTITGVPKGTDVTLAVTASDSFLGKPTYTFHVSGAPADAPISDNTLYVVNESLARIFLPALKVESLPAGSGVVAGSVVDSADTGVKGVTANAGTFQAGTSKLLYVAGLLPNELATETDDSGRFVLALLPAGETTITIQRAGSDIGSTKAIVYDQSVSLANVIIK